MTLSYLRLTSMLTALKKIVLLEEFQGSHGYSWIFLVSVFAILSVFLLKTHILHSSSLIVILPKRKDGEMTQVA